jgi:hypothetical protein
MKETDNSNLVVTLKIKWVCDECCMPLSLYGENMILTLEGDIFITRMLCDLHAFEFFGEE